MINLIKSPWKDVFIDLVSNTKNQLYLASPFIKLNTAELIIKNCNNGLDIKYLTDFKLSNFHKGASDLDALKFFGQYDVKQKNIYKLHAKFFIFDNKAVITSSNLTFGGLKNNIEYGILVDDNKIVQDIKRDYLDIFNNKEYPFIINDIIKTAENIIASIPVNNQKQINISDKKLFEEFYAEKKQDDLFDGGVEGIAKNLKSWEKDVFLCLDKIKHGIFQLADIYQFEDELKLLHPSNRNIQPKIRQQLQYLRDIGLIEFISRGVYRKLWV